MVPKKTTVMIENESEGFCEECPTIQEHYIANILDSLGQWNQKRVAVNISDVHFYTWDFLLVDIGLVIQADGVNGHGTRYSLTDDVVQCRVEGIKSILHLEDETEEALRKIIVKALDSMSVL
jgi:hypothetical protein